MSSVQELHASIAGYKSQLLQVDEALKNCSTDTERESLSNLRSDLQELLDLTNETLHEQTGGAPKPTRDPDDDQDPFESEMNLFRKEIEEVDTTTEPSTSSSKDDAWSEIKEKVTAMIGQKCNAPHLHSWGASTYHNAMVCGLDHVGDYEEPIDVSSIRLRVMFTNPTHQEMLPCSYFLDGECRFSEDKCRFSHGELVPFGQLKDYREPNFALLEKIKYPVLVKQKDRLWHKGRVVSSCFTKKTCTIRLDGGKKEVECPFGDVLPLHDDAAAESDESSSGSASADEESGYEAALRHSRLLQQSLLNPVSDQPLGEWEKHTKGFGSQMMRKYGYVIGTGLGQNGEGIIVPITAQVLPAGRSLDYCMELREQANGDCDLFSAERRMKQRKKRQEQQNSKAYEREKRKVDVFSFMNETVFAGVPSGSGQSKTTDSSSSSPQSSKPTKTKSSEQPLDFHMHSTKNLNVAGFKIGDDIRKMERDIQKMRETMARHKSGTPVFERLRGQLNEQMCVLEGLKRSETSVTKEQLFRKDKSKLTIF